MATDRTNAERQRRWRERQARQLPPAEKLICSSCGGACTGSRGALCRNCWRRTPEGREWQRLRLAAYRSKKSATP
jgi:hypothetical protein